ncbi:diguanylate cyclase (plasmid) [Acetobacter orientalis]|uniref:Diguanylate cyclase n=1 Tax=Acetobacter orientalis TaxID=146474 RepID=A0A2Z5ZMP1_9PROT|nr:diguanylate cyclase [Acetobacter orientalis]
MKTVNHQTLSVSPLDSEFSGIALELGYLIYPQGKDKLISSANTFIIIHNNTGVIKIIDEFINNLYNDIYIKNL